MGSERYQRIAPLGSGGQGHTYRALDRQTGRQVALKELALRGSDWKRFDLFERECKVLAALEHPAIPRYLDTFAVESEGRYVLVMELVEGEPLQSLLERGMPLSEGELYLVLHQALDVLAYLHGLHPPVFHRDVKPANLIRRPDNRLALVDFGGVRLALRPEGGSTVVGTFGYMAPEQLHGEAGPATDIYGLGATLAALACGESADKLPRRGLAIDLNGSMSPGPLRELLRRMLAPDPQARLQSVADVRRELGHAGSADHDAARDAAPRASGEVDEVDEGSTPAIMRMLGHFGVAALILLDVVLLPLVFAILLTAWGKTEERRLKLERARRSARKGLREGRAKLRELAQGKLEAQHRLPPPRNARRDARRAKRTERRTQRR